MVLGVYAIYCAYAIISCMIRHYLRPTQGAEHTKKSPYFHKAFTIVELLVIITVIVILAAITIVSYTAVTDNAKKQTVKTDALSVAAELSKYKAENGVYPNSAAFEALSKPSVQSSFQYTYNSTDNTYCLTSSVKGASAYVKSGNSLAKEGGCDGHGVNGDPAVTNLAYNPSAEVGTSGLSGYFSSPVTRVSGGAAKGSWSFSTTTNSSTQKQGMMQLILSDAKPSQTYSCSVSIKGTPGKTVIVSGRPAKADGGYIGENFGGKSVTLSSTWQIVSITFATTADTGLLRLQEVLQTPETGVVMQADAIICTEGSTIYKFADGSTANWAWLGAEHNSASSGPAL